MIQKILSCILALNIVLSGALIAGDNAGLGTAKETHTSTNRQRHIQINKDNGAIEVVDLIQAVSFSSQLPRYGAGSARNNIAHVALSPDGEHVAVVAYAGSTDPVLMTGRIENNAIAWDQDSISKISENGKPEHIAFEEDDQTVEIMFDSKKVFAYKQNENPQELPNGGVFADNLQGSKANNPNNQQNPDANNESGKKKKALPVWLQSRMMRVLGIGTIAVGGGYLVYQAGKYIWDKIKARNTSENKEKDEKSKKDASSYFARLNSMLTQAKNCIPSHF